jgi:hypothetical protein
MVELVVAAVAFWFVEVDGTNSIHVVVPETGRGYCLLITNDML